MNPDTVFDYDAGFPGYNLFVYCGNNPANRIDISGADSRNLLDGDKEEEYTDEGGGNGKLNPTLTTTGTTPNPYKQATGYIPPTGGGGVSDTIQVGETTVTFGHGGRHLEGTGLTTTQVNTAIAEDVVTKNIPVGIFKSDNYLMVGPYLLQYTAKCLSETLINVGTYYLK